MTRCPETNTIPGKGTVPGKQTGGNHHGKDYGAGKTELEI